MIWIRVWDQVLKKIIVLEKVLKDTWMLLELKSWKENDKIVQNIIDTVVDTIQGLLAGIGAGVVDYFESLVLIEDTTPGTYLDSLNPFGIFLFVLLGIGAAFAFAKLIFSLVRRRA